MHLQVKINIVLHDVATLFPLVYMAGDISSLLKNEEINKKQKQK